MIFDKKDFIELIHTQQIKTYNFDYLEKNTDKEWILLIGHENTLTGAPLCLYELALCVKKMGYIPVIAAPREGKLIEKYKADLIPALVVDNLFNSDLIDKTLHVFSLTFVNTIVASPLIRKFNNNGHNIIWWIHESEPLFDKEYVKYIPTEIADNIKIYCVSDFAKAALIKRRDKLKADILTLGVNDMTAGKDYKNKKQNETITFFSLAPITKNKGQDLLLEAIDQLSEEVRENAHFIIAGEIDDKEIYDEIQTYIRKYPNTIEYIDGLSQEEVKKYFSEIDCYICSSRGESLSRTTIEACSAGKLIICSDSAGICEDLIKDKSGFVYHGNDTTELSELIETVTRNYSDFFQMRENARETYAQKYSYDHFNNSIKEIISRYRENSSNNYDYCKPFSNNKDAIHFDIYMDVLDSDALTLRNSINSVRKQSYGNWNLKLINCDSDNLLCKLLIQKAIHHDKRISKCTKYSNENNNDYIVKMTSKIVLDYYALQEIKSHIEASGFDFIYSDNIDVDTKEKNNFKPDYSVDTLRSYNYIGNFYVVRESLIDKIKINCINNDYEVILKATNAANNIGHIAKELYSQRSCTKQNHNDSNVISSFLNELGYLNTTMPIVGCKNKYRVVYEIKGNPLISIIICNKNNYVDLKKCIDSINKKSTYRNFEIIIIDNGSTNANTLKYYDQIKSERVKIVKYNIPFNYSKMNNKAIEFAKGEHYLFLNNDIEVISENWLEELLMYSQRDDVGAVGAKLYYPDNKIQHAGVRINSCGEPEHVFAGEENDSLVRREKTTHVCNYIAVTGACLMLKASKFKEVGCFDENLTVTFNDIDLCVKLYANNYNNVWTPFAELYHYESKTRGQDCLDKRKNNRALCEFDIFNKRWNKLVGKLKM